jgi:hypothetical protein
MVRSVIRIRLSSHKVGAIRVCFHGLLITSNVVATISQDRRMFAQLDREHIANFWSNVHIDHLTIVGALRKGRTHVLASSFPANYTPLDAGNIATLLPCPRSWHWQVGAAMLVIRICRPQSDSPSLPTSSNLGLWDVESVPRAGQLLSARIPSFDHGPDCISTPTCLRGKAFHRTSCSSI